MRRAALASVFARGIGAMNAVGTAWILLLMALVNLDVLGRELAGTPIRGVTEIVSLSIVAIVFLQLAHALWAGRLTRNDALLRRLERRAPRLHRVLEGLFHAVGCAIFALLAGFGWLYVDKAWRIGEYVGALGDFTAPTWPVRLVIVVGSAATAVAFALRAVGVRSEGPRR